VTSPATPCRDDFFQMRVVQIGASFVFRFRFFNKVYDVRSHMASWQTTVTNKGYYVPGAPSAIRNLLSVIACACMLKEGWLLTGLKLLPTFLRG
jgi:hypothetical protein